MIQNFSFSLSKTLRKCFELCEMSKVWFEYLPNGLNWKCVPFIGRRRRRYCCWLKVRCSWGVVIFSIISFCEISLPFTFAVLIALSNCYRFSFYLHYVQLAVNWPFSRCLHLHCRYIQVRFDDAHRWMNHTYDIKLEWCLGMRRNTTFAASSIFYDRNTFQSLFVQMNWI